MDVNEEVNFCENSRTKKSGGGGGSGGGEGVRVDLNKELNFFVKIKK